MKLRHLTLFVALIALLSGCANDYQKISVSSFRIASATDFGLSKGKMCAGLLCKVAVSNESKSKFEISEASALLSDNNGTVFANVAIVDPVTIAPACTDEISLPLEITLFDPMYLLTGGSNILSGDNTADIVIKVRQNAVLGKTIERKKVPVKSLIKRFKIIQQ